MQELDFAASVSAPKSSLHICPPQAGPVAQDVVPDGGVEQHWLLDEANYTMLHCYTL